MIGNSYIIGNSNNNENNNKNENENKKNIMIIPYRS